MNHQKEIKKISKLWFWSSEFKKYAEDQHAYYSFPGKKGFVTIGDSRWSGFPVNSLKFKNMLIYPGGVGGTQIIGWSNPVVIQSIINQGMTYFMIAAGGNDLGGNASDQKIIGCLCRLCFAIKDYTQAQIIVHGILPIIRHGNATNEDVIRLNGLIKDVCIITGWNFIDLFPYFYNYLSGWIQLPYLNLSEAGTIPHPLLMDLAEMGNETAKKTLLNKYWKNFCPVHFSQSGNDHWLNLLKIELDKIII